MPRRASSAVRFGALHRTQLAGWLRRGLCAREGIEPCIRKVDEPHGPRLGSVRCIVEQDCARLPANRRLVRRQDRHGGMMPVLLRAAGAFIVASHVGAF